VDKVEPKQDNRKDNRVQEYQAWFDISNSNGWLIYKKELEKIINVYRIYMDNPTANAELIKNYQLIKKGLQMAFDIPKSLEFKAKIARKEMR